MQHKKRTVYSLSLFLLFFMPLYVVANNGGINGYAGNTANGVTCSKCHNIDAANQIRIAPEVKFVGPTSVAINSVTRYKFVITGGQQISGGLNLAAEKGELMVVGIGTSVKRIKSVTELTQDYAVEVGADGTTIEWSFDWKAPATEGVTRIFGTGLSSNADSDITGDMSSNVILSITVTGEPVAPIAVIKAPYTVELNGSVAFDASASSVLGSNIKTYLWQLLDGTSVSTAQADFRFTSVGDKTVRLTVTSDAGLSNSTFFDIHVVDTNARVDNELVPIANLTAPTTASSGDVVSVDTRGSRSLNGNTIETIFDYGDGSAITTDTSHTYTLPSDVDKIYTVTLAVQDGNLTNTTTTKITITPAPLVTVKTGESLYKDKCESCHGVAGVGIKKTPNGNPNAAKNIRGSTALFIENSLQAELTMQGINVITGETQLIATFLGQDFGNGTGNSLYVARCIICHGDKGVGITGVGANIQATSVVKITDAINGATLPTPIPLMAGINLTPAEAQLIVDYVIVVKLIATGKQLYEANCLRCHGVAGIGDISTVIVNTTTTKITNAINTIPTMNIPVINALLADQIQLIADYLIGEFPGDAKLGEQTFIVKCQMCHGTGSGGAAKNILNVSELQIRNAIATVPDMKGLILTAKEKLNLVALLLKGPIPKPITGASLFTMYCSYCHGATGQGGKVAKITLKGQNVPAAEIKAAYSGEILIMGNSNLRNAGLSDIDLKLIENYLQSH